MANRLFESIHRYSDKIAFETESEKISYTQLHQEVATLADWLAARGIQGQKLVAMGLPSGMLFIKVLLALVKNGLITAPLSVELGRAEREKSLEVLSPNFIITSADKDALSSTDSRSTEFGIAITELPQNKPNKQVFETCPNGGFIRFTSGTTGTSKGVLISAESAYQRAKAARAGFVISEDDIVCSLMDLPFHFIASLFMFLQSGVTTVLPSSRTGNSLAKLLSESKVSVIYAAPFHYESLISSKRESSLSSLRLAISTSCAMSGNTANLFRQRFGIGITQSLGIIEVGLPISAVGASLKTEGCLGVALPDYEVKTLGDTPDAGLLAIKGPGMFDAYLEPFRKSAEVLKDGWFVTDDIAHICKKTKEVTLRGRASSVVNLAGHKIFVEEVEDVLGKFPGVSLVKVSSMVHEVAGEVLIAELVADKDVNINELRRFSKQELGQLKTPKQFIIKDSLSMTASGKVKRDSSSKAEISIIGGGPAER